MNFRQLSYFVQIVESGSFSQAAAKLNIAQPALSQHVLSLERELGSSLLSRHARGVRVNEVGKIVYDRAISIIRDMNGLKSEVARATGSPRIAISVGLPTSACRGLMVPLTQAVASALPNVDLHIVEAMSGALEEWIGQGRLDVALIYEADSGAAKDKNWQSERLFAVTADPDKLGLGSSIEFANFSRLPLVMPRRPTVIRVLAEQWAAENGLALNVAITCDSFGGQIEMLHEGYVGLMSKFCITDALKQGTLRATEIVDPQPRWLIATRVSRLSLSLQCAEQIDQILQHVIRKLFDDGVWEY